MRNKSNHKCGHNSENIAKIWSKNEKNGHKWPFLWPKCKWTVSNGILNESPNARDDIFQVCFHLDLN